MARRVPVLSLDAMERLQTTLDELGDVVPHHVDRRIDDVDRREAPDIEGRSLVGETRRIMAHT